MGLNGVPGAAVPGAFLPAGLVQSGGGPLVVSLPRLRLPLQEIPESVEELAAAFDNPLITVDPPVFRLGVESVTVGILSSPLALSAGAQLALTAADDLSEQITLEPFDFEATAGLTLSAVAPAVVESDSVPLVPVFKQAAEPPQEAVAVPRPDLKGSALDG